MVIQYFHIHKALLVSFIFTKLILIFSILNKGNTTSPLYPRSLTLLDNSIALFANDGIHFYDEHFSNEDTSKKIPLSKSGDDIKKIAMAQFCGDDGGYILILALNILYLFDYEGNKKKSYDISTYINGNFYRITPYKKDSDNYLHFIITYANSGQIYLSIFKINLSNLDSLTHILKQYSFSNANGLQDMISCLILSHSNKDLLTCFCGYHWPANLYSTSFDPESNYDELNNFQFHKLINNTETPQPYYVSAETNEDKQKAIIYTAITSNHAFWATFDFNNKFSEVIHESLGPQFQNVAYGNLYHNIFYFPRMEEFVLSSRLTECNEFIMVFNKNFKMNYKGIFYFNYKDGCTYSITFTIFHNGANYTVLTDNQNTLVWKQITDDFETIPNDYTDSDTNNIQTTIP